LFPANLCFKMSFTASSSSCLSSSSSSSSSSSFVALSNGEAFIDTNSLIRFANSKLEELQNLWNAIGLTSNEKDIQLKELAEAVRKVYTANIASEKANYEALELQIQQHQSTIAEINEQLQRKPEPVDAGFSSLPLRQQLEAVSSKSSALAKIRDDQMNKVQISLDQLLALRSSLGVPSEPGFETLGHDISDARLVAIQQRIQTAEEDTVVARREVVALVSQISDLVSELCTEEKDFSALDALVVAKNMEALGVHRDTLHNLEVRKKYYSEIKRTRHEMIKVLAHNITTLWSQLFVPQHDTQEFLAKHSGLGLDTIKACEDELARLLELKNKSLKELIGRARTKLFALWDETEVSMEKRREFLPAFSELYTDEFLVAHEEEIVKMEKRAAAMRPLLVLVKERNEILRKRDEYEVKKNDSNKFRIPGLLLEIESFEKQLHKDVPRIEAKLRKEIPAWEAVHGPFEVNGMRFLDRLDQEYEMEKKAKAEAKAAAEAKRSAQRSGATPNAIAVQTPAAKRKIENNSGVANSAQRRPSAARNGVTSQKPNKANAHAARALDMTDTGSTPRKPENTPQNFVTLANI